MTAAEIKVGRRAHDGTVELSVFTPQLVTLRVTHGAERAAAVQLTRGQVGELRRALGEVERLLESEGDQAVTWDGSERRRTAA